MKIELDDAPIVARTSWVGKVIGFTGAKTWCSLLVRGAVALMLVAIYVSGLFHLVTKGLGHPDSFFYIIWMLYTMVGSLMAVIGSIFLTCWSVDKFNCWAQNQCTPIFKDDVK